MYKQLLYTGVHEKRPKKTMVKYFQVSLINLIINH